MSRSACCEKPLLIPWNRDRLRIVRALSSRRSRVYSNAGRGPCARERSTQQRKNCSVGYFSGSRWKGLCSPTHEVRPLGSFVWAAASTHSQSYGARSQNPSNPRDEKRRRAVPFSHSSPDRERIGALHAVALTCCHRYLHSVSQSRTLRHTTWTGCRTWEIGRTGAVRRTCNAA
jgi:hypothetical protein